MRNTASTFTATFQPEAAPSSSSWRRSSESYPFFSIRILKSLDSCSPFCFPVGDTSIRAAVSTTLPFVRFAIKKTRPCMCSLNVCILACFEMILKTRSERNFLLIAWNLVMRISVMLWFVLGCAFLLRSRSCARFDSWTFLRCTALAMLMNYLGYLVILPHGRTGYVKAAQASPCPNARQLRSLTSMYAGVEKERERMFYGSPNGPFLKSERSFIFLSCQWMIDNQWLEIELICFFPEKKKKMGRYITCGDISCDVSPPPGPLYSRILDLHSILKCSIWQSSRFCLFLSLDKRHGWHTCM